MEIFNGDSLIFNYSCCLEDNLPYEFKKDEIVKTIIYNQARKECCITHEIPIEENTSDINIHISSSEMRKLKPGIHILEIKLITNSDIITTYQENVLIKESWVINE